MLRRDFLAAGLIAGVGLKSNLWLPHTQSKAIAKGGPLKPPTIGLINVAIAVSEGTTWIDFVGPESVFTSWHYDDVDKKHKPKFKVFYVSEKIAPVSKLIPDYTFENAPKAEIVLVPAQVGSPALLEWLKGAHKAADLTMSVCIGARHLALAGLLEGKEATTHHDSIEIFKKSYPDVNWISGMRFVEGEKISTGGGLTAGIDLALRVVERYFGREKAIAAAEHLEYESRGWVV